MKIEILLAIMQAAMTYGNDPRINATYALIASNNGILTWIVQAQDRGADILADEAVKWAIGLGAKPNWVAQAGL